MKKFSTRIGILLLIISLCATVAGAATLVPGGQLIGLQLEDDTVTVAGFQTGEAGNCGLQKGDRIVSIDGKPIHKAQDVKTALAQSDGQVSVTVLRGEKTKAIKLTPSITAEGPRLGVYLRQGTSGLGTVTFYDPDTGRYGALGHGVNDSAGKLLQTHGGNVYDAAALSVNKGQPGKPGQILGQLRGEETLGNVQKNVSQGIFGKATFATEEPLPVAARDEVHTGSAIIRSTVDGCGIQEYSVEILKIYPAGTDRTRNMLLHVTDQKLLQTTGGIVQGMSGSPIIQDGKLVGAVTHVLVNDPTTGYGIFIENMLEAAS